MKFFLLLPLAAAAQHYSTLLADSVIARNTLLGIGSTGSPQTTYEHGVVERALQMVYNATGDGKYLDYLKWGVDNLISPTGRLLDYNLAEYSLDDLRLGQEFLYLWRATGEARYRQAAETLRRQLDGQPTNSEGGYWHRITYPNQMWLDGQYMTLPFYAEYTQLFAPTNATAWSDIAWQFTLLQDHTRNPSSGLLAHGYDGSHAASWAHPVTGAAPHVWDRALGWYAMALVDVLDYFPERHPGRGAIKAYFRGLMEAVRRAAADGGGLWWLVMDQPHREGNYRESSGSAMFVYALLKGVRKGYIPAAGNVEVARRAYRLMAEEFVVDAARNGTVDWEGTVEVGSLKGDASFEYYVSVPLRRNDLKGIAAFIYASIEYEKRM